MNRIDTLVASHTAFRTMAELLAAQGNYFPSLRCKSHRNLTKRQELLTIANWYDETQELRGDNRRAFRC